MKFLIFFIGLTLSCATTTPIPSTPVIEGDVCEGPDCEPSPFVVPENRMDTTNQDFVFQSMGSTLRGSLFVPVSDDPAARHPGVVIAHDFGPLDRNGSMRFGFGVDLPVEVEVYRGLAEELSARGFAVLIYDKRTCVVGGPPKCTYPRTYLETEDRSLAAALLSDLEAAVQSLKARADVDQARVSVIGHGHGAELALALNEPIWKKVLLTWAPISPMSLVRYQLEASTQELRKRIGDRNDAETDEWRRQLTRLESDSKKWRDGESRIRSGESFEDFFGLSSTNWMSFEALHKDAIAKVDESCAFVLGGRDHGFPKESEDLLRKLSEENVLLLESMSHLLVDLDGDSTLVSPDLLDARIAWLGE